MVQKLTLSVRYWGRLIGADQKRRVLGGVSLPWDMDIVSVQLRYTHKSFLHAVIFQPGGRAWELTSGYANPNASIRKHLWVC